MHHEWLSQKDLIEQAGIEQPTMAATLGRMERDGIIARRSDPHDKRSVRFSFTPAMREKIPAIRDAIDGMNIDALAGLTPDDKKSFKAMLAAMISSVGRMVEP